jgi:hypothetical protein
MLIINILRGGICENKVEYILRGGAESFRAFKFGEIASDIGTTSSLYWSSSKGA